MPNHVTNNIRLSGDDKRIAQMLDEVKSDDLGIGTLDFNKVIPMPESLNIQSGSMTDRGLKAYKGFIEVYTLCGTRNMDKILEIPEETEAAFLKIRTDISPEEFALGKQAFQNEQKYGATDWYHWCVNNWGTKWNSYGYDGYDNSDAPETHTLSFNTAWSAPHRVLEALTQKYPDIEFTHEWADEDFGHNCGRAIYLGGERTELYFPETQKEAYEFAASVMGCEVADYNLMLNASGTDYIPNWATDYTPSVYLGQPALYTIDKLTAKDVPQGLYHYPLQLSENGEHFILNKSFVEEYKHGGTIILKEPVDFGDGESIPIKSRDEFTIYNSAEKISFDEFINDTYSIEPVEENLRLEDQE